MEKVVIRVDFKKLLDVLKMNKDDAIKKMTEDFLNKKEVHDAFYIYMKEKMFNDARQKALEIIEKLKKKYEEEGIAIDFDESFIDKAALFILGIIVYGEIENVSNQN